MRLVYSRLDRPNFGDDSFLFGIGTILNHTSLSREGRSLVLGSGTGYGDAEPAGAYPRVDFRFVRGPLNARRMGLPAELGICDPAILTPEVLARGADHGGILFVPHLATDAQPLPWSRWCAAMDVEYLSPTGDSEDVIRRISGARLVLAESMHAAIIADAYRVPWVAVQLSPGFNEFKWRDWANSLDMEFTSVHHPAAVGRVLKGLLRGRNAPGEPRAAAPASGSTKAKPAAAPGQWTRDTIAPAMKRLSLPLGLVFRGILWQALRRRPSLSSDAVLDRKRQQLRDALDRTAEAHGAPQGSESGARPGSHG